MSPIRTRPLGVARITLPPIAPHDSATAAGPGAVAAATPAVAKQPAIEPVAVADIPPPGPAAKQDAPVAVAEPKAEPAPATTQPAPLANERKDKTEPKAARRQWKPQTTRAAHRARYRVYANRYAAPSYYWASYRRAGATGISMPYTPGFGPAPYSSSGN
jgi:hypothetical protein